MSEINVANKNQLSKTALNFVINRSAVVFLIVMLLFNVLITPNFFSIITIWNLIIQSTAILFVALGMTFVISSGGIDISVGSIMSISAMLTVKLMPTIGTIPAIFLGLVMGTVCGLFNGLIISVFKIQPIIVTLTMMIAGRGIAQMISAGNILPFADPVMEFIALRRVFNFVPIQVVYVIVAIIVFLFMARRSVFARYLEAIGDNYTGAKLAGINIVFFTTAVYTMNGMMSALAGILTAARTSAADPDTIGKTIELSAIAAVAIGGTPMSGGKAKVVGTFIGVLIIQLISITINMNNISYDWSLILKTIIIILAVYIQNVAEKRSK